MIQTFTPISDVANHAETGSAAESLTEDEELFYASIKGCLNKLEKAPSSEIINTILNYSKTF